MPITAADFQVQASLQGATGIPADRFVNTLAFRHNGIGSPTFLGLTNSIRDFYAALTSYMPASSLLGGNNLTCTVYSLVDPLPRAPVFVQQYAVSFGSSDPLPTEVAVCSSFAATAASGVPPARRRGRIYVGPLAESANSSSGQSRPLPAFITALADATEDLATDAVLSGFDLSVWSRRDSELFPVARGWVDNAWDTQRRRGIEATARTSWAIAP